MQIALVGFTKSASGRRGDNAWIGSTCTVATLYRGKKMVGTCLDTPNAIACAVKHTSATRAVDGFGETVKLDANRVEHGGWMQIERAGFVAA